MADKLLRFKDMLKMDGQEKPLDRPKLSFDDLHVSQYRPGEDELINYRAYRRKRAIACEETDYSESVEHEVDEALTFSQRIARKKQFRKFRSKIQRGREKAKRRIASKDKLMKRTRRQVRQMIIKKLTKDIPKSELTYQRRMDIEKRLDKPAMKARINVLAKKHFPKVYKAELAKKRGSRDPK